MQSTLLTGPGQQPDLALILYTNNTKFTANSVKKFMNKNLAVTHARLCDAIMLYFPHHLTYNHLNPKFILSFEMYHITILVL